MSNEAQHLLNHIQYKTGKSLSVIAKEIGYSRPHLNKAKLNPIEGGKIVGILKTKYANELKDVPGGTGLKTQQKEDAAGVVPATEVIQILKEQNEFLRRTWEASLTGILVQGASILAHVATSLEKDDEREAAGNKEKLQQLQSNTGRRIAEKMGAGVQKNKRVDS